MKDLVNLSKVLAESLMATLGQFGEEGTSITINVSNTKGIDYANVSFSHVEYTDGPPPQLKDVAPLYEAYLVPDYSPEWRINTDLITGGNENETQLE